jgi:tetratricopeptide (TPR) repeat protein
VKSDMASFGNTRRRLGRLIAAIVLFAAVGAAAVFWREPILNWLNETIRPGPFRLALARQAYDQGNWKRAIELARQILKSKSDDPDVLRIYARSLARLERHDEAARFYKDRIDDERLEPEDFFLMGLALVRKGDTESALTLWEKGAKRGPDNSELLDHLSRLAIRMQHLDLAADAGRKLAHQPGWEARALLLVGETEALVDNASGAVEAVRQGLDHDQAAKDAPFPVNHYRRLLARSLLQLARPAEARVPLEAIFAGDGPGGGDSEANWLLSRAYLQEGRIADASAALDRAGSYRAEHPLEPEPGPYVGAARCAPCHRDETRAHMKSRHSRTFHHGRELLDLPIPDRPLPDPDDRTVTHTFEREGDRIEVETRSAQHAFKTIAEYAFGIRGGYMTMIGRDDERVYRALRLSSYHTPDGVAWGRTAGDVAESDSADKFRGQPIGIRDGVVRCLYCHVTRSRDFRDPPSESGTSPAAADPAIGCERCHGPGKNHVLAVEANLADTAIITTRGKGAAAINKLCSDCHVVGPPSLILSAPDDPSFIRSPGVTLTVSRCYTASDGALSCLTCHDPHFDADRSAAYSESKCLSCHRTEQSPAATDLNQAARPIDSPPRPAKVCPENAKNECLGCHMPKIKVDTLHMSLTDHYIRVRRSKSSGSLNR